MVTTFKGLANKWVILALLLASLGAVLAITLLPLGAQTSDAIELTHNENDDGPVGYFTAADPEGDTARWSEMTLGGTDAAMFNFDDGVLSFKSAPNFERPGDVAGDGGTDPTDDAVVGDNTYEITLTATDGNETSTKTVEVEVQNMDEDPTTVIHLSLVQPREGDNVTVVYADGVGNPYLDTTGTANTNIVDPDGDRAVTVDTITDDQQVIPTADVEWQWYRGSSRTAPLASYSAIDGATSATYSTVDADRTRYLRVTATYEDNQGMGKSIEATSDFPVAPLRTDNEAPEFTDSDPTSADTTEIAPAKVADGAGEGTNIGSPITASRETAHNERLTYSLEGATTAAEADYFQIDRVTGQVSVGLGKTINPASDTGITDGENGNEVAASFTVTIKAVDGYRDKTDLANIVESAGTGTLVITVDPQIDEAPVFTGGEESYKHPENTTAVNDAAGAFAAFDPDGGTVVLTLTGPDASKFTRGAENVLTDGLLVFTTAPNFEDRGSDSGDNNYQVTVTATSTSPTGADGDDQTPAREMSTSINVTVMVTNADEDGNLSLSAREPRIGVPITAMVVSDADGAVSGEKWQWQRDIVGTPTSASADCSAASLDADDQWEAAEGEGAKTATYTPETGDFGKCLRATATYSDPSGDALERIRSGEAVEKARNLSPMFMDENEDASGIQIKTRYVIEPSGADTEPGTDGVQGRLVVRDSKGAISTATINTDRIVATDLLDEETDDDDNLVYTLTGGDTDLFEISNIATHAVFDPYGAAGNTTENTVAGQISVKEGKSLDYETRRNYRVRVTVKDLADDDESRNDPSVWVEIRVADLEEGPDIMSGRLAVEGLPLVEYESMDTADVATYSAVGVDADGATWSLEGDDAGDFSIGRTSGVLTFINPPDFASPADANMDNIYEVMVKATSGESTASKVVTVTVGMATVTGPRTDIGDYSDRERFDLNGDGMVSDAELLEAITIWTLDSLDN